MGCKCHIVLFIALVLSAGAGANASSAMAPASASDAVVEPTGVVTLNDAVRFALVNHPALRAFPWARRAAEALAFQAGRRPNPELEVEVEEFAGSGDRRGFDEAEISIQLGQLIELGNKRAKRAKLAGIEADLVQSDYESTKFDVMYDVTAAFVAVLAAQEQLTLAEELAEVAERTAGVVEQRVTAGKDSPVEQAKARVVAANARLERTRAEQRLLSARTRLALAWGRDKPQFDQVTGDLYGISSVPPLDEVTDLIDSNPDVRRWDTEIRRRHAVLEVERTRRVPDVGVRGGLTHFNETDDTALVMGLSIPLPTFDRNRGAIEAAGQRLAKTRDDRAAVKMDVRAALAQAISAAAIAFAEADTLKNEVVPAAQSAYEAAERGYRQGKFDYLDVLDAQRTLFEARGQYVLSVTAYHESRALAERLIGRSLPEPRSQTVGLATPKPLSEEPSDEK